MNTLPDQQAKGPASLAATLLDTLEEECASLARLQDQLNRQMAAIREHDQQAVEETAIRTSDEVNILARLKLTRDRQIRLLGRVLRIEGETISLREVAEALETAEATRRIGMRLADLRDDVSAQAGETRERCRDLEFALEYSVHLGRELLQAIQGVDMAAGGRHYTSHGSAVESAGTQRSFLNRVG